MKYQNRDIIYILFIIPLFKPYCIPNLYAGSIIDILFDILKTVILFYVILLSLIKRRYMVKPNAFLSIVFLYHLCLIVTYLLAGNGIRRVGVAINCITTMLVLNYLLEEDKIRLLRCLSSYLCALLIVNLVLFWIFPNGLNNTLIPEARVNFLGQDNNYLTWALLSFFCACCYSELSGSNTKIRQVIVVINTLFLVSASSSTGLIAWILILIFSFLKFKVIFKKMRPAVWIGIFALVNVAILLFNAQMLFEGLISAIFRKNGTFSNRIIIWETMKLLISQNPLFGIGKSNAEIQGWYGMVSYSHNTALDILLKGGGVALTTFIGVLLIWENRITNMLRKRQNKIFMYCSIFLIGFMIEGLMEGIEEYVQLWAFLMISYGIGLYSEGSSGGILDEKGIY